MQPCMGFYYDQGQIIAYLLLAYPYPIRSVELYIIHVGTLFLTVTTFCKILQIS